jgi:hypothetical protein
MIPTIEEAIIALIAQGEDNISKNSIWIFLAKIQKH